MDEYHCFQHKTDDVSFSLQVAKVNSKENSYTLKDEYYRHVQKDWPGYTEEEKQLLHRLLMR